jgi:hypothetical protein
LERGGERDLPYLGSLRYGDLRDWWEEMLSRNPSGKVLKTGLGIRRMAHGEEGFLENLLCAEAVLVKVDQVFLDANKVERPMQRCRGMEGWIG